MSFKKIALVRLDSSKEKHKAYLQHVLTLEQEEGWEIINTDIKSLLESNQTRIYFILSGEDCIGSISFLFDPINRYIAIGAFIIAPELRGHGLGEKILSHCIKISGASAAGLLSSRERIAFYKRLGFHETEYAVATMSLEVKKPTIELDQFRLSEITEYEKKRIIQYDTRITGIYRGHFLYCMLSNSTVALAAFDGSSPKGYALARPFNSEGANGFRVSLYADDSSVFKELLSKIINHLHTITDSLLIKVSVPYTYRTARLSAYDFKLEGGPYPFMTTTHSTINLLEKETWFILTEEFC